MKLLVVVDYQYDFAAIDGKLSAGEPALKIEENIINKISAYQENGHKVVYTLDCHDEMDWSDYKHPEGKIFARHCIKGSEGYELYGSVKAVSDNGYFIEKRAYCPAIENTVLEILIQSAEEIEVCGLVTDICVFQTVIGLYTYIINHGLNLKIAIDCKACASFNPEREAWALKYMEEILGVILL